MISIGGVFRGPELESSAIWAAVNRVVAAFEELRPPLDEGRTPWVNAVFFVPGSLGQLDFSGLIYGDYSKREKGIVVQIAVPANVVASEDPGPFLIMELHGANAMAFAFFEEEGEDFPLREAEELVFAVADKLGIVDPVKKQES